MPVESHLKPVNGHQAVVSDCGCRRQSADGAFGFRGRCCFPVESGSDPDLTCCFPSFVPSVARGRPRDDYRPAVLAASPKGASKVMPIAPKQAQNKSSACYSMVYVRVEQELRPSSPMSRTRQTRQYVSAARRLPSNGAQRFIAVLERSRCFETVFSIGTVHAG